MLGIDLRKICQIYPEIQIILPLKTLFVSVLSQFYANLVSILGQNAPTESVLFLKHEFDPLPPFEQC